MRSLHVLPGYVKFCKIVFEVIVRHFVGPVMDNDPVLPVSLCWTPTVTYLKLDTLDI